MPRNMSGVYSKPAGTTAVPNTLIESAKYNETIDDLVADANAARPITAGGTAATSKSGATTALEAVSYGAAQTLTAAQQAQVRSNVSAALKGHIYGLTLSNNASDTTNDIDFAAGECASTDAVPILMVHSAGTAQLDVAYGTGNGGLFDSAISNGTWHCFVISNGTTVARGFSQALNPTLQPNYPAGYSYYRRVGSILRNAGSIRQFVQREDHFDLQSPVVERSSTAMQAATLLPISVPFGIVTQPKFRILQGMNTAGNIQTMVANAGKTEAIFANTTLVGEVDSVVISGGGVFTNTSSQIQFAVTSPGGGTLIFNSLTTDGWIDTRGRS